MIGERLAAASVGVAGAGGLGSNCAVALARAGVGRIVVADFDEVSESNLDRQYFFRDQVGEKKVYALEANIARIDPKISVEAHDERLDPDSVVRLFSGCDAVVEALDDPEAKRMIAEAVLSRMPGTPLVMGSGLAGWGANNRLRTRRSGDLFVCGDEAAAVSGSRPPMAPRVGVVACMQANQVLEILLGEDTGGGE